MLSGTTGTVTGRSLFGAAALLAATLSSAQPPPSYELALVDHDGRKEVLGHLPGTVFAPRVSPDGTRVAFDIQRPPENGSGFSASIWVADLANLADRRALPREDGPLNWAPMWAPDGERVVYLVNGDAPDKIYWRRADGTGGSEHLVDGRSAEGWSHGGARLMYLTLRDNGDYGIASLDMAARTSAELLDLAGTAQHSSNVSRDGRWVAYASNETGRYEVWVEPLPRTGERSQITQEGGGHPMWSPDGRALFFDRGQRLYRVEMDAAKGMPVGEPMPLPIEGFAQGEYRRQFDLLPNGRQFLLLFPSSVPSE